MREIKFRAWNGAQMMTKFVVGSLDGSVWGWDPQVRGYKEPTKRHHVLMQFTGLKDKSGKEIYEGDVIKVIFGYDSNKEPQENSRIGAVEYFAPYAMFALHGIGFDKLNLCPIEVIGNIYENPELL